MTRKKSPKTLDRLAILAALALLGIFGFFAVNKTFSKPLCANSISCIKDLTGKYEPNAKEATFLGSKITPPAFIADTNKKPILGEVPGSAKRIEINLSNQTLYAYQNDQLVYTFRVSTGKWGKTPTGTFHIWVKLRYTRMTGGSGADYYDLPNVPFVMFFYNDQVGKGMGFSLHGTYWHNNFGHTMSHGCVNLSIADAQTLYNWTSPQVQGTTTYATDSDPGTEIRIYGTAPLE